MQIDARIAGRWVEKGDWSNVEYVILFRDGQPFITARCISDCEMLEILDLKVANDSLSFDTLCHSTGYRGRHVLRFSSPDLCEHEITSWEAWKRTGSLPSVIDESITSGIRFDQLVLATPRLRLRPLKPSDAEPMFRIFSDPDVMRYWSTPPWASIEEAHKIIERDAVAMPAGEHVRLGMEIAETGEFIGMCSLFDFDKQSQRCMLGYGMSRDHWGSGYMHEALVTLIDHAFGALGFRRIEADIDPRNTGSARSLERLGFVKEGHLRERWKVGEEISDSDLYGLLRREWSHA
jgi:ribosomal-protein-alanine N-acetyltransferase